MGRSADVRTIGKELGVARILEGSVRREGQRVRVTAQLINVADGMHVWSKAYDREGTSLLEIEQEITDAVVNALRLQLIRRRTETTNPQAHELYLKGRHYWHKMTPENLQKSIDCMEQAIALDPGYAAAYAGLSDAWGFWTNLELEAPGEPLSKASRLADKALQLDPDCAECHFVKAAALSMQWKWDEGEREFRHAVELGPSLSAARMAFASLCLGPQRRYQEAIAQFRRALETDPLSTSVRTILGQTYVYLGQPDRAIKELREALELEAGFPYAAITLGLAYLEKGAYQDALDTLLGVYDSTNEVPYYIGVLGYTHAKMGNRDEAQAFLRELETRFKGGPWIPPVEVAGIHNGLGDEGMALSWLERASQQRSTQLVFVIDDPRFRNLYDEPRFEAVLAKMGLKR